jgi:capsular exopolysaccharide synthesis family protein
MDENREGVVPEETQSPGIDVEYIEREEASGKEEQDLQKAHVFPDPPMERDVFDEIGKVFEGLERMESSKDTSMYSQNARNSPARGKKGRRTRRGRRADIDWMKAFVEAPFQYQEAFLSLRTNIKFLSASNECKKIIITSSVPGEGKTSVAVNLALALSAANSTVALVDADLRKPRIHHCLRISGGTTMGLTNILQDKDNLSKGCVRRNVDKKGLSVIPCGVIPPNPTELLGSPRMELLIKALGESYDYVIIDTAPVSIVTDAAVLSQFADGVLFVVRQKDVTFEQARQAKKNLDTINAKILGVVINDFNLKHLDKSGSYYYSYYRYGETRL